jgi:hypothetical protein
MTHPLTQCVVSTTCVSGWVLLRDTDGFSVSSLGWEPTP